MNLHKTDTEMIAQQSQVFKALGHPARLAMVGALCQGEQCVCELRDLVNLDMSTVSKHLSVLRSAGVVTSEKRGNWMYYRLDLPCVPGFLNCLTKHFSTESGHTVTSSEEASTTGTEHQTRQPQQRWY